MSLTLCKESGKSQGVNTPTHATFSDLEPGRRLSGLAASPLGARADEGPHIGRT